MLVFWSRETRWVFGVGLLLLVVLVGIVAVQAVSDPSDAAAFGAVIAAALLGGRIPAIVAGLEGGFSSLQTSLLIMTINTAWLCLTFPVFVALHRKAADSAWLKRLQERAQRQVRSVSALGCWGLAFFVWLPFPLTGALIGAVIGIFMNLSVRRVVTVVVASMWLGVIMWTFGFDVFMSFSGPVGKAVCYAVAIGCIVYSLLGAGRRGPEAPEGSS